MRAEEQVGYADAAPSAPYTGYVPEEDEVSVASEDMETERQAAEEGIKDADYVVPAYPKICDFDFCRPNACVLHPSLLDIKATNINPNFVPGAPTNPWCGPADFETWYRRWRFHTNGPNANQIVMADETLCLEETPFRTEVSLSAAPTTPVDGDWLWKWYEKFSNQDHMGNNVAYVVSLKDPLDLASWPPTMTPYERLIAWIFVSSDKTKSNKTMDPNDKDSAPIPPTPIFVRSLSQPW